MLKRITVWALVVGIVVLGGVLGRKAYRRAMRVQASSTAAQDPPKNVQQEPATAEQAPTNTETFLLKDMQTVHVAPVASAMDGSKEWTQFLGAGSHGHSPCAAPVEWSESKNIAWKI